MKFHTEFRDFEASGKSEAFGTNGMIATSHPSATLAGIDILREGGNAVDAAVCAAAVQAVVEPTQTGIGGDCFALIMRDGDPRPIAINGSGWSAASYNLQFVRDRLNGRVDPFSPHTITVPGAIDAWAKLVRDHGRMDWERVLAPAIEFAAEGYCVTERIARDWQLQQSKIAADRATADTYLVFGRCPAPGDIHRQPPLANTLRTLAKRGGRAFYEGELADTMVASLNALGSVHTTEDFGDFSAEYSEPISASYRGFKLWECPPNGQGAIPLLIARLLERYPLSDWGSSDVKRLHLQAEAARLAYAERDLFIADPRTNNVPVDYLLSDAHVDELRSQISQTQRMSSASSFALQSNKNTVFIAVVDRDRTAVSLINSLFDDLGSGITCPTTGILFHNRGSSFSLEEKHPNVVAGRKRPMNTIIPALLAEGSRPVLSFGVTGGHFQPIGQFQILANIVDYGMPVQSAIDFPRMFAIGDTFEVERTMPQSRIEGLMALGHRVTFAANPLGTCQTILIDHASGVFRGGADGRKDGIALGW